MAGYTDIHQHIAYGIDDGPSSLEESVQMLAAASADGVQKIIATPHVEPGRALFDMDGYMRQVERLNACCRQQRLSLAIYPGAEILFTQATLRHLRSGEAPTLAGSTFVLVEFPPDIAYRKVLAAVEALVGDGYTPVIAHIERYACLVRRVAHVRGLKERFDLRLQVNCNTLLRRHGFFMRSFIAGLMEERLIDYVASDAHNITTRPVRMKACCKAIRNQHGPKLARALTGRNQAEIFA